MLNDKVGINVGETQTQLEITKSTIGPSGINVSNLLSLTGLTSFDPAFANTASVRSSITYIDGENGVLLHRGYPIQELARDKSFLDVAYLLSKGNLPSSEESLEFDMSIRRHTLVHENMMRFFSSFQNNAHPMSILSSAVSALATYYQSGPQSVEEDEDINLDATRLMAKLPVLAAYTYKTLIGQPFIYPDNRLSLVENFLRMTFGNPAEDFLQNPIATKTLDTLLLLHADHEQNCSTSTVRLVGSGRASLFASVASGINALSGPLHGGANEAVLLMLKEISKSGSGVADFVSKVKAKEEGVKLMGFGHRVYKSFDPRARIVKEMADTLLLKLGVRDPLLDVAKELESVALNDDYFIERKLYPNVDFYTGVIYKALGFPPRMFTPLFAIGRLPGWIAHWQEMMADPTTRIGRPQQVYVGPTERHL